MVSFLWKKVTINQSPKQQEEMSEIDAIDWGTIFGIVAFCDQVWNEDAFSETPSNPH